MTAPRRVLPGGVYLATRRVTQRQFLLLPDKKTREVVEYLMAVAAKRCNIGLIAWTFMSNHYHVVAYDKEGRLPEFLEHLNKLIARCLNARWGRKENFWASDAVSIEELTTPGDIFNAVVYALANPVAANLVEHVDEWPGASSLAFLKNAKKRQVCPRPEFFFSKEGTMPEEETLKTVPIPQSHTDEPHEEWAARVLAKLAKVEAQQRATRRETNIRVLGRTAVQRASHTDTPKNPPKKDGMRDAIGKQSERQEAERQLLREFWALHHDARGEFAAGNRNVEFPPGTYRHRLLGGCCAKPPRAA